jgi:cob(I)alamin adenosyltransferase
MQKKKAVVDGKIAAAQEERGVLVVNTGNGKGKSSAAFGVVARASATACRSASCSSSRAARIPAKKPFSAASPAYWHVGGDGFTWETQDKDRDAAPPRPPGKWPAAT